MAVESPACGMLMMHKSSKSGMEHVMALDVAPGETLAFAPGGYHLMCMDSKLKPGTFVPVTFTFSQGAKLAANFAVRNAMREVVDSAIQGRSSCATCWRCS